MKGQCHTFKLTLKSTSTCVYPNKHIYIGLLTAVLAHMIKMLSTVSNYSFPIALYSIKNWSNFGQNCYVRKRQTL